MSIMTPIKKLLPTVLCGPLLMVMLGSQSVQAEEAPRFSYSGPIKVLSFGNNLKVRGLEVSKGIYMGQAKVAGKYGVGVVFAQKNFSWGINNRGISFTKRF